MLIRRRGEEQWRSPSMHNFSDEKAIQTILEHSPDLLPGTTREPLAVARELSVPNTGYLDLVAVDANGKITLVECKLKANSEIRRHVIGQVFAYAAALWDLDYETFDAAFAARTGCSLDQRLSELVADDWDETTFRENVASNLSAGRFQLVIVVDQITDELSRVVRYVNGHTTTDLQLLALELEYVADEDIEILVPMLYGVESAEDKAPSGQRWTEASVFEKLAACCSAPGLAAAHRLYAFAKENGASFNWGVGHHASVTARLVIGGQAISLFTLSEWPAGRGVLSVNFAYLSEAVPRETLAWLAEQLREISGVDERFARLEEAEFRKRPTLELDGILSEPQAVERIMRAFGNLLSAASS